LVERVVLQAKIAKLTQPVEYRIDNDIVSFHFLR
jgi:hypothetical protein